MIVQKISIVQWFGATHCYVGEIQEAVPAAHIEKQPIKEVLKKIKNLNKPDKENKVIC